MFPNLLFGQFSVLLENLVADYERLLASSHGKNEHMRRHRTRHCRICITRNMLAHNTARICQPSEYWNIPSLYTLSIVCYALNSVFLCQLFLSLPLIHRNMHILSILLYFNYSPAYKYMYSVWIWIMLHGECNSYIGFHHWNDLRVDNLRKGGQSRGQTRSTVIFQRYMYMKGFSLSPSLSLSRLQTGHVHACMAGSQYAMMGD